jgi:hypothetical protein
MPKPTAIQETGMPSAKPRVRHVTTGHEGIEHGVTGDSWFIWALVRWDRDDGPGMRDKQGLARVAPRLLERFDGKTDGSTRRAGGRS